MTICLIFYEDAFSLEISFLYCGETYPWDHQRAAVLGIVLSCDCSIYHQITKQVFSLSGRQFLVRVPVSITTLAEAQAMSTTDRVSEHLSYPDKEKKTECNVRFG